MNDFMTERSDPAQLPDPAPVARDHSDRLRLLLRQRITEAGGLLSFSDYMSQVLYEPGLGYYMAGAAKFGAHGDFVTAPEVSPLFGATLAQQAQEVLSKTGGQVLELGAGSGKLALAAAQVLMELGDVEYFILEPSAELVQRQQHYLKAELCPAHFAKIRWLDTLPSAFTGVIIANEVMDALPVERFRIGNGVAQLCVSESLETKAVPAPASLLKAVSAIEADLGQPFATDYESEVCLLLRPWVASLARCLRQGVVLLVDYGYPRREFYLPERSCGTLTCYYRHRAHADPYHWPGLQDITAHVDFTAVAEAGTSESLELLGYASQSAFLIDNDLLGLAESAAADLNSEADRIALSRAVKTLTLPGEMGERFQVMAFGKGYDHALQGFRTQDLCHRL